MKKRNLGTLLAVSVLAVSGLAGAPAVAQTDAEYLSAVNFRFNNPGARARGLGGAFVAQADDATAAVINPAGLAYLDNLEASVQFESDENDYLAPRVETGVLFNGISFVPEYEPRRREVSTEQEALTFASVILPIKRSGDRHLALGIFYSKPLDTSAGGSEDDPALEIDAATFPGVTSQVAFFPVASFVEAKNEIAGLSAGFRVTDRFAVGGSLGVSRFDFFGISIRSDFFSPTILNSQASLVDEENALFATIGGLWRSANDKWTIGGSWQLQTEYDMNNLDSVVNGSDRFFTSKFTIPTRWALGASYRPADGWVIAAEVDRIEYSDLFEGSKEVSFFGAEEDSDYAFEIDDVHEIHLGAEYTATIGSLNWSFRGGFWRDRAHPSYYTGSDPLLRAWAPELDQDVDHFTVGIGLDAGRVVVDVAADFSSDAGNDILASLVFRPGRQN
jgi:long-chain fatty acid transport protein